MKIDLRKDGTRLYTESVIYRHITGELSTLGLIKDLINGNIQKGITVAYLKDCLNSNKLAEEDLKLISNFLSDNERGE